MNFDENRWRKPKVTPEWGKYQKKNFEITIEYNTTIRILTKIGGVNQKSPPNGVGIKKKIFEITIEYNTRKNTTI